MPEQKDPFLQLFADANKAWEQSMLNYHWWIHSPDKRKGETLPLMDMPERFNVAPALVRPARDFYDVPTSRHLEETYLYNYNSEEIVNRLAKLYNSKDSQLKNIERMFWYAADEITYIGAAAKRNWKDRRASDVVSRTTGVCNDKAIVLTTMLRGINVPARMIRGRASEQQGGLEGHAWVEAWHDGRWIKLDPTFMNVAITEDEEKRFRNYLRFGEADGKTIQSFEFGGTLFGLVAW